MKMLRHRHALLLVFALSPLGCDQLSRDTGGVVRPTPSIDEGKATVARMISVLGRRSDLARMEMVLNQPDFSGALKEWGCIAVFDETGRLTKALTMKVVDFRTGERYPVREFTGTELEDAREQILAYRETLGVAPSTPIPIFSHSFRLAVAAAAVNEDSDLAYLVSRGTGDTAEQMQVTKIAGRSETVIAADALYQVSRQ
jgi:hypothetical protein